jgi:hypothetical protein
MAVPAGSAAQGLPSDPEADSPSGVVYELPVERARQDAAPRDGTPQSKDGGGGAPNGTTNTSIRSENNFGTSSEVPGAAPNGGRGSGAERGGEGAQKDAGRSVGDVARSTARTTAASTEGPSDGVVFPLVAVLLAVGVAIGMVGGRRSQGGRRG